MDALTLIEISAICGGKLVRGDSSRAATRISKDTRTLLPGDLYFALRGESFDGNRFAVAAANKGAIAVVIDDPAIADALPAIFLSFLCKTDWSHCKRWQSRGALNSA